VLELVVHPYGDQVHLAVDAVHQVAVQHRDAHDADEGQPEAQQRQHRGDELDPEWQATHHGPGGNRRT
jgi:hypothetical protein